MPAKPIQLSQAQAMLETLITDLGNSNKFACLTPKSGRACTAQHEDEIDKKTGRDALWFATDCRLPETFCPSCRAYWHVAVAMNCLRDFERMT